MVKWVTLRGIYARARYQARGWHVRIVLGAVNYEAHWAFGEFVDNVFQSSIERQRDIEKFEDGYSLKIEIDVGPDAITVRDNAGGIA